MDAAESIRVRVLFFGATADVAGTRATSMDFPSGTSTGSAFESIIRAHPALASHKLLYSINQTYASGVEILRDDDELAVFTAVSGG